MRIHPTPERGTMRADSQTRDAIVDLITETYRRLSTPGSDAAALMSHPDFAVTGSGQGELAYDHKTIKGMADAISSWAFPWIVEDVTVWQQGDVAWAQIIGSVTTRRDGVESVVPYWTTGVFARGEDGAWGWRYWGGAEPQEEPRV
jgi:hypothetical protein